MDKTLTTLAKCPIVLSVVNERRILIFGTPSGAVGVVNIDSALMTEVLQLRRPITVLSTNPSRTHVFAGERNVGFGVFSLLNLNECWTDVIGGVSENFMHGIVSAVWIDEQCVAIATRDGMIRLLDIRRHRILCSLSDATVRRVLRSKHINIVDMGYSNSSKELLVIYEAGDVTCLGRWSWPTRTLLECIELPFTIRQILPSISDTSIFIAQYLPGVIEFDFVERRVLRTLLPHQRVDKISLSDSKTILLGLHDNCGYFADINTGAVLLQKNMLREAQVVLWDGEGCLYMGTRAGQIIVSDDLPFSTGRLVGT